MAFGLQRDRAAGEHKLAVFNQLLCRVVTFVELWFVVFEHDFAIQQMTNDFVVVNFDLSRDPLFAMVSF